MAIFQIERLDFLAFYRGRIGRRTNKKSACTKTFTIAPYPVTVESKCQESSRIATSKGANHDLFSEHTTIQPRLTCSNDGKCVLCTIVKGKTSNSRQLHPAALRRVRCFLKLTNRLRRLFRSALYLHYSQGCIYEVI